MLSAALACRPATLATLPLAMVADRVTLDMAIPLMATATHAPAPAAHQVALAAVVTRLRANLMGGRLDGRGSWCSLIVVWQVVLASWLCGCYCGRSVLFFGADGADMCADIWQLDPAVPCAVVFPFGLDRASRGGDDSDDVVALAPACTVLRGPFGVNSLDEAQKKELAIMNQYKPQLTQSMKQNTMSSGSYGKGGNGVGAGGGPGSPGVRAAGAGQPHGYAGWDDV